MRRSESVVHVDIAEGGEGPGKVVLSGGAVARITASMLTELVITDSIEPTEAVSAAPNIRVTPIASLLGEAIARTASEKSVSSLFD